MAKKGILEVQLVRAKKLADTDVIGAMDPYVLVEYRNQEHKSSVAIGQGTKPAWNQTFKFMVQYSETDHSQHKLILRIMDEDDYTGDDFVGQTMINVGDIISLALERGKGEPYTSKYRVVLADLTYCGEIEVGVTFTPKVEDEGEGFGGRGHNFYS